MILTGTQNLVVLIWRRARSCDQSGLHPCECRPSAIKDVPVVYKLFSHYSANMWLGGTVVALVIYSIVLHELAHAVTAHWCGDRTGKDLGRITLNPIPNISPIGSLLVPIVALVFLGLVFGWAKPVPVVPDNYRKRFLGECIVSMAGIVVNLLITVVTLAALIILTDRDLLDKFPEQPGEPLTATAFIRLTLLGVALMNMLLALFNLIPIPPLDGHHIAKYLLPKPVRGYYERIGFFGLILVLLLVFWQQPRLFQIVDTCFLAIHDALYAIIGS